MATTPLPADYNPTFTSRRSPVLCRNGCVASSQPLASYVGVDILRCKKGANAADAAVAVAASLCTLEPFNAGLGGDMFCLYYDATDRKVFAINGSGKSPNGLTRDIVQRDCPDGKGGISPDDFKHSPHAVTVPGLAQGLEDLLMRHGSGKFTFSELVEPAAKLAEEGFPVTPTTAQHWKSSHPALKRWISDKEEDSVPFSIDGGRPPRVGEIFSNPDLAHVLRELGAKGAKSGFYSGRPGHAIVESVQHHGGMLTQEDMDGHSSLFPDCLCAEYRQIRLWQIPPNGQGIAALVALTGLAHIEERDICDSISPDVDDSADAYHAQIEMMHLGFKEVRPHIACPDHPSSSYDYDQNHIRRKAEMLFDPQNTAFSDGKPESTTCTVSFQVVDSAGNAASFLNSNFNRTGIVPKNCGFILQNRGFSFSLSEDSPNSIAGGKRPFNTMIAGMLTHADTDELFATMSNIGGYMQPQGHLQLTVDMVAGMMDPQGAIDKPRFCITDDGTLLLEEGFDESIVKGLKAKGHNVKANVSGGNRGRFFGHAQIIKRDRKTGVLWAGSDGRTDGCAIGY